MHLNDFDYVLPSELIAQHPIESRCDSRLMFLDRSENSFSHHKFSKIADLIPAGSLLVLNNTRVIPARIICYKKTGAEIEVFLIRNTGGNDWECMLKPAKRVADGTELAVNDGSLKIFVKKKSDSGFASVELIYSGDFWGVLARNGKTPIPPYIKGKLSDPERYQTVYATEKGSVAAPTAGLHFTPELLKELSSRGIGHAFVTLHVGPGTFRPVQCDDIREHIMDEEFYSVPQESAAIIDEAWKSGRKIIAVGTTSVRTLESAYDRDGNLSSPVGSTRLFIYPGYSFAMVNGLITNFHLPKSTLIMLASAFAGKDFLFRAYEEAIKERYRMYSFGDAMFII